MQPDPQTQALIYAKAAARGHAASMAGRVITLTILFCGIVLMLLPLYIMLVMALKTQSEMSSTDIWAWPTSPTFQNFIDVLKNPNQSFPMFLRNTSIITFFSTAGVLFSSAVVAYGFSRLNFAGKDRLFIVLLATMMLPGIVTMIPTYVLFAKINWVDTFLPLTVPAWLGGGAFNIFLLRQFFMGIPRDLDEAAILDGASQWTIFSKVILPLSGPALATVGIFTFIGAWKDFMGPLIYLNDPNKLTLEVGLRAYAGFPAERWHMVMAGSVLVMIPLVILFFLGQRWFVKGIVMTGIK